MASLSSAQVVRMGAIEPTIITHRLRVTRSDDYAWTDVHLAPFAVYGLIALRAPDLTPRFNLSRRRAKPSALHTWMNWHRSYCAPVERLSLTVLHAYVSLSDPDSTIDLFKPARQRRISVVRAFGEDCLCSMPKEGGCIPLEALRSWWQEYVRP